MRNARLAIALLAALCAPSAAAQTAIDRSIPAAPDARVELANVRGEIVVTGWDEPRVALAGSLGEGSTLRVEGEGARISVRVETEDGKGWSWWGRGGMVADTRLEVRVPRAVALDVDVVSADLRVDGIVGSREVAVDSVSGDVRLAVDTQRLKISSVSGDVEMEGAATRAILETVSGDLVARGLSGEIDLETVSGDARITAGAVDRANLSTVAGTLEVELAPRGTATIRGKTMSGELRLRVPADLSARIEAETFSGGIRSDFGTVDEEEDGPSKRLRATAGEGAARLELETFSGDLEIRRR
ncbi:MAG: DUF4097 domain-containing protein [Xanthomonadaceae bacterium]|jgi:hypothetical protein|nr:DUF4097 domain-containing protein [Xanthomonadaceae bacterium]